MDSPHGRLFAVLHEPLGEITRRGNVLVVPAFNEEMNRCRSMVTLQAQALAALGFGTLTVDLFGTGESDGGYGDARWEIWIDNICQAMKWLDANQPGGCVALLGIRLGVPLAIAALQKDLRPRRLISWQALSDGKSYFMQFMRMRLAANMDRTDIPKETTAAMREQLAVGTSIEIAGYEIAPELVSSIESIRLSECVPHERIATAWFEKGNGEELVIPSASQKLLADWRQAGRRVDAAAFVGPAFWALHERHTVPELISQTSNWLQSIQ